jgi:rhomboid protease GluP
MISTLGLSWEKSIYQFSALHGYFVTVEEEYYRLFTSMFVHNDLMHIMMNMLSIYMLGRMVERLFRGWAYLSLYFVSGLFGSYAYMYMSPSGSAVGASGAIFGVFGALAGYALVHRKTMQDEFMQFMRDFGIILVINFFIGMIFPNIAMSAHVGGLVAGVIGGIVIAGNPKYMGIYILFSVLIFLGMNNYLASSY